MYKLYQKALYIVQCGISPLFLCEQETWFFFKAANLYIVQKCDFIKGK